MPSKNQISVNDINPVDYYNFNKVQHTIDLLLKIRNIHSTGINALTYVKNKSDEAKQMIVIENGYFIAKMSNGLGMEVGKKYTPFMMLQKFIYKDNYSIAINYVIYELMNADREYIRVGTKYYKKNIKTDRFKIKRNELKIWDRTTLIDDFGKDYLDTVEKFNDFTIVPDNKNFKPIIGGNYNVYSPFSHKEAETVKDKDWVWTRKFLKHIFGEHYELGLKYIKTIYDHPKQVLPILVLISETRQTGKTTFVDWLTVLFGANAVIVNPQDISNQFNGTYADKNLIIIEESFFDSRGAIEKLKNLSTQKTITVNSKFIQQYSIPFYGKIIITSNDEDKFIRVDDVEIRYWVRKVPEIKGKANHNILNDMCAEIPYFLAYLSSLPEIDTSKSRMVFEAVELVTDALNKVKKESRSELHKEIEMYLDNHCLQNSEIEQFYFIALDIKNKFFLNNSQIKASYINKVLRSEIKLEKMTKTKRYIPIEDMSLNKNYNYGKPYIYKNKYFGINNDKPDEVVLEEEINLDMPF